MAQEVIKKMSLQVVFVSGEDEYGGAVCTTKTFNNINQQATAEELWTVAKGIASLQTLPLDAVNKVQTNSIEE